LTDSVGIGTENPAAKLEVRDTTASSATQGGGLRLSANDGAAMASGHRLGVLEFAGAEDGSGNIIVGGRIEVLTEGLWSASDNSASMLFYTTDGNNNQTEAGRLTSDGKLRVAGNVIQASDGGTTITMDTDDNVTVGGAVTATTGLITNGYFSNGAFEDIYSGGGADAIVADKSVIISTDASGATKQYTLPSASGLSGRTITFKNVGTGNTTIAPVSGSEKIDHDATTHALIGTSNLITLTPWQSITLMAFSDGLISQGPAGGETGWLTLN